jgi:hypothetical protein
MQTKHLRLKCGARVTAIHSIAHETYKGVASWFFIGDLEFEKGKTLILEDIAPIQLCADLDNPEAKAELDKALEAMNDHLLKHGRWLKKQKWVGERLVSWVPKRSEHQTPIN